MSEVIGVRRKGSGALIVLATLLVLGVGGVTGWSSWGHIVHVGLSVGEPSAMVLPVAIDGMMLASTVVGAWDRLHGMKMRFWAIVGLWAGALLTLTFNMISAYTRGVAAMAIAVLYAVTFLVSVEMLFHPSQTPLNAASRWRKKAAVSNAEVVAVQVPQVSTQVAKPNEDVTVKPREFPPGTYPAKRPDRKKTQYGSGPGNGKGSGGLRPAAKPAEISVHVESKDALPPAMGEKVSDLVSAGANGTPDVKVVS